MGGLQRRASEHHLAAAQRQSWREPGARRVQFHPRAPSGIPGWRSDGRLLERTSQQRRPRIWWQRLRQHGRGGGAAGKDSWAAVFFATDAAAAGRAISKESVARDGFTVERRAPRPSIYRVAGRDARLSIGF